MAEQIRKENQRHITEEEAKRLQEEASHRQEAVAKSVGQTAMTSDGERLKKEIDEILDEIDNSLLNNEEVMMAVNYTQMGGQ